MAHHAIWGADVEVQTDLSDRWPEAVVEYSVTQVVVDFSLSARHAETSSVAVVWLTTSSERPELCHGFSVLVPIFLMIKQLPPDNPYDADAHSTWCRKIGQTASASGRDRTMRSTEDFRTTTNGFCPPD